MNKKKQFNNLIKKMRKCNLCQNITKKSSGKVTDCSLINIFKDEELCLNIPTIWTDWYSRIDADIMIIGQDWGPLVDMEKYRNEYIELLKTDEDAWYKLVKREENLTHKKLVKFLEKSAKLEKYPLEENFKDKIYFTNAVMCARQGESYKDTKYFDVKKCTLNCTKFLKEQIDIVKPKIIVALGYHPLLALSKVLDFEIGENLVLTLLKTKVFNVNGVKIIPVFHPVAQVKEKEQLNQYRNIWSELSEL